MILAALELVEGDRAELREDGTWQSSDAGRAAECNAAMRLLPVGAYRPAWAANVAAEVAAQIGGRVVFVLPTENDEKSGPQ